MYNIYIESTFRIVLSSFPLSSFPLSSFPLSCYSLSSFRKHKTGKFYNFQKAESFYYYLFWIAESLESVNFRPLSGSSARTSKIYNRIEYWDSNYLKGASWVVFLANPNKGSGHVQCMSMCLNILWHIWSVYVCISLFMWQAHYQYASEQRL